MKSFYLLVILLSGFSMRLWAQHPPVFEGLIIDTVHADIQNFPLKLVKYTSETPKVNFLVIHDNEDTGVKAAFEYIMFSGGSILDCQYGGVRNYKFTYNDDEFQTDPNSIYTTSGIRKGLEKYGWWDRDVARTLEETSARILKFYSKERKPPYIFTLHNNADGGFGISSYLKGYDLEGYADSLHINFQMDPDDLILVTDTEVFNKLKKANVNVILQSKDAPDDGSLSVYAMQHKIPYINVEVQHGHYDENLRLIEIAIKALSETFPELLRQ